MIALALLFGTAHADDALLRPLPTPVRAPAERYDCPDKEASPAMHQRPCDAISVPPTYMALLEGWRVYGETMMQREADLIAAVEFERTRLEETRTALRKEKNAAAWRTARSVVGAVVVAGGTGYLIGKVTP